MNMESADKAVQQTVTLPAKTAERVQAIASSRSTTTDRVLAELIDAGLETEEFTELVDRLAAATDPGERKRIKEELARLTFGE